jgi:hypothetical protein
LHLVNTIVLKNNITDVLNNRVIAVDAAMKYPSYLLGRETTLIIWYRTTRFGSVYTKSQEIGLLN